MEMEKEKELQNQQLYWDVQKKCYVKEPEPQEIEPEQSQIANEVIYSAVHSMGFSQEYWMKFERGKEGLENLELVSREKEEEMTKEEKAGFFFHAISEDAVNKMKQGRVDEVAEVHYKEDKEIFISKEQKLDIQKIIEDKEQQAQKSGAVIKGVGVKAKAGFEMTVAAFQKGFTVVFDKIADVAEAILDIFDPPTPRLFTPQELFASKQAQAERKAQLEREKERGAAIDRMAESIRKTKAVSVSDLRAMNRNDLEALRDKGGDYIMMLIRQREQEQKRERMRER